MDCEVYLQKCYCSSSLSRFKAVSRAAIETVATLVSVKIPIYRNCAKGSIKCDVTALHFEKFILHPTILPHYFGVFGSGDLLLLNRKILVLCRCFFPPQPPSFRYFKRQDPEKTFLLVPIVFYFKWKKCIMLNLNTKTLWMCKLQNSKSFSLCQCKPPKEQRIKYTLSSLTMIEHVPVLKSAAGSHSNPSKQSRAFSNKHEKKRDILTQISAPALLVSYLKIITLLFQSTSLSRTWGRKK